MPQTVKHISLHLGIAFDNDGKIYEIQLFFYEPQSDDHYINHIVARISGPFSHVEIAFPTYTTHIVKRSNTKLQTAMQSCALQNTWTLYGSSIFQSGVVFFQEKEYSRDGYTAIGLRIDKEKHMKLLAFCQKAAASGIGFDPYAMARSCLPFVFMPDSPTKTFCSKYVTDALQFAGVEELMHLDSRNTTPSTLYHCVQDRLRDYIIISASPGKLKKFTASMTQP